MNVWCVVRLLELRMPSGHVATVTIVFIYAVSNSGPDLQMQLLQVKYLLIYLYKYVLILKK